MSKRSKACDISQKVKRIVWERDHHACIYCRRYVPMSCANSHYIKRSQGGLGIPENIVTACPECHFEYDNGKQTNQYRIFTENYLKRIYGADWNIRNLIYRKGENDYDRRYN